MGRSIRNHVPAAAKRLPSMRHDYTNPYLRFLGEFRDTHRHLNKDECTDLASKFWAQLPEERKERYRQLCAKASGLIPNSDDPNIEDWPEVPADIGRCKRRRKPRCAKRSQRKKTCRSKSRRPARGTRRCKRAVKKRRTSRKCRPKKRRCGAKRRGRNTKLRARRSCKVRRRQALNRTRSCRQRR